MGKEENKQLSLITTEGKEIIVSYKWDDSDDDVLTSIREALKNNIVYFEDWADFEIKFGEHKITELDFKKIIGIIW